MLSQAGLGIVMIIHQPGFVYWPRDFALVKKHTAGQRAPLQYW